MIKRLLEKQIEKYLFKGKVIIVFGPRQAGKSTLLESLLKRRREPSLILNGDEADVREMLSNTTSTQLRSIIGTNKLILIDEAQRIPGIGLTLKLFSDQIKEVQVIASGSSAFELADKTNESLTGRKFEYFLLPLSFQEMVNHSSLLEERRLLEQRLIFGYYPEIVTQIGMEAMLLKLLADSYLYKDLLRLEQINKPVILEKLIKALALQVGSEVSYLELSRLIGVDKNTVEKYIDLLEKAFVLFKLPALSGNSRNEIKKKKKIYFYDNGIRNAVIGNFNSINTRTDIGAMWENFIISERQKYILQNEMNCKCYFWRNTQQQEVDYIEECDAKFSAFELKWSPKAKAKIPLTFKKAYTNLTIEVINSANFDRFLLR